MSHSLRCRLKDLRYKKIITDREYERLCKALDNEPCESCCNGEQTEKAKLCQKSYIAGMEHARQEPYIPKSVIEDIRAEIERATIEMDYDTAKVALDVIDKHMKGDTE